MDLHVHTARCRHATGSVSEFVDAARQRALDVIAFTDHLPLWEGILPGDPGRDGYAMPPHELDDYVAEILDAAQRSRAEGGPEVLLGIECDWAPGSAEYLADVLARYPFDVVLGSVHFIDEWPFDDPARREGYASWAAEDLWDRYFADVAIAAGSGLFDVISHPDLVKKFDVRPDVEPLELYESFARALAAAGVAAEVNTAGLRKPCAELYPGPSLLDACARAGVPMTIGSDAHAPTEVGEGLAAAEAALRTAGYGTVAVFHRRIRKEVPL